MKFIKRLFRFFSIKGNKALKKYEDSIEVYEYELKKSKENLDKLADSQSKLRADKKVVEDKKAKAENYVKSLQSILDKAVEQNDDALGEETMALMDSNEKKVEMFQVNIESYDNVLAQLEQQYATLKEKYNEKIAKLDGLKAQNEFAKNMEAINTELKAHYSEDEFDFTSFEKIEEELKGKIYYEQDRNARFTPEPSLEERVAAESRKSKFQEYKEQKAAEQAAQAE
jgi:phage shock protein A